MTPDLLFAVVSFILYGGAFLLLLYVGYIRPSWRWELVGVLFIVGSRVALYAVAMAIYSGAAISPSHDFLSWLSRVSSLIMGIMANVYIILAITRHK